MQGHLDTETSTIILGTYILSPKKKVPSEMTYALHPVDASVFQLQEELETPLFADGHVVGIYWENISRSIVERTHRDAKKLDVPLYCLQAADQRASYKNKIHEESVTHSVLTVPNIHNTGKLPGMLLVHIEMIVRLSDVMAPRLGLVKDKLGKVLSVVLHEDDQRRLNDLPEGYHLFVPNFMAKGIWVQMQNYRRSPLCARIMQGLSLIHI